MQLLSSDCHNVCDHNSPPDGETTDNETPLYIA